MNSVLRQGMTISDQLARHAAKIPDEVAIRFLAPGGAVDRTYAHLDERVDRLANAWLARGVRSGDRIAVLTLNTTEAVEAYFACARIGAIVVTVNFRLVADEVAHVLNDSGASVIVVDEVLAPIVAVARKNAPSLRHFFVIGAADSETGWETYEHALEAASSDPVRIDVDEHSASFIIYTSGTTGRPKGAVLTHYGLFVQATNMLIHLGVPIDAKVWLISTPLFHIGGVAGMLSPILRGDRLALMPMGAFDPAYTLDVLERERVNVSFFVPAQWQLICDAYASGSYDLSALRVSAWGAAPATPALLRTIMDSFPDSLLYCSFGMTETAGSATILMGVDALEKIGSVGTPLLNVEVRIVDNEMRDVVPGEVGEIVYRGPTIMKEYWNNPSATRAAFEGGWFHSGDLVRQDADGYIYVVDRLKDMFISGGENVYSAEIEIAVSDHPKVAEVAVIGVPDEKWGEVPLAIVVPAESEEPPTAAEIEAWCRERLAAYKVPRRLSVVDALPRNASGKVLKIRLREEFLPA
ncbi:long-chain-fatty-acid--CoA ligase [Nocardia asteroides]|uniref:long-chain-fatty-acid--CoA ligase n=1 Tax=Nocardia asteroides TaxID=1824 RepID=UPI001E5D6907|nr:long-chain-fatty-acid--CoA ligase [Nocardia asteroides]UGT55099.1 long-chain-fatty-acid--CoA ligase [Nocardia asteroides]